MALANPNDVDRKLTDAIAQINQILANFDKRLTELEEATAAKKAPARKAS